LGQYALSIVGRNELDFGFGVSFAVEEYKKPEFEVAIQAPTKPKALGDKFTATIKASYYFGGPVTQARVHYTVKRTARTTHWFPGGLWDWCFGPGYWWFWPDYGWYPGWAHWGMARPSAWRIRETSIDRSMRPEVVVDANVPIGPDGTVTVTIDTALAKTQHGDSDHRYEITADVTDQSRRTIEGSGEVLVARRPFDVFVWADRGYYRVGDAIGADFMARTLDGKAIKGKGVATLYRVTFGADAQPVESAVQAWDIDTDEQGQAHVRAKASQAGQYRLSYKLTDATQQTIEGAIVLTILGEGVDTAQFRFNALELIPDRREYNPGDKVRLLINTNRADSTVVLFVRAGM
jgi:uncharacterized protein YfaS (alpha-2-macroglobulin family)